MENRRMRWGVTVAVLVLGFFWISPNFIDVKEMWWPSDKKLNLGLDIQGGLHLVMGVDVPGVMAESTKRMANIVKEDLKAEGVTLTSSTALDVARGEMELQYQPSDNEKIVKFLTDRYPTTLQIVDSGSDRMTLQFYESYLIEYKKRVVDQAIETIRNRIDEFGVAEPSITAQGDNRILVQLPGIENAEAAKALINTAARLDFMLVSTDKTPDEIISLVAEAEKAGEYDLTKMKYSEYSKKINEDLKDKLPKDTLVYFEKQPNAKSLADGALPYLLKTDTDLSGDALDDAYVAFDQYGKAEVQLIFNTTGKTKFADITGANTGRQLAVVLDKVVKTAPNINGRIPNGRAVITLGSTQDQQAAVEEAQTIATSLRAGALPASLEQLEERTVGPTLGADSIEAAEKAGLVAAILVILFMCFYYKMLGVIASICLGVNVFLVLALLSSLGATLTLPGVAGIVLTVGMAVDANVIIYERIKEEIRKGSAFRMAVKEGYARALSAIIDANITTGATAFVLMYFGTGPVRGFAVTLLIGIITTLFTGVFLSHFITDLALGKSKEAKLAI